MEMEELWKKNSKKFYNDKNVIMEIKNVEHNDQTNSCIVENKIKKLEELRKKEQEKPKKEKYIIHITSKNKKSQAKDSNEQENKNYKPIAVKNLPKDNNNKDNQGLELVKQLVIKNIQEQQAKSSTEPSTTTEKLEKDKIKETNAKTINVKTIKTENKLNKPSTKINSIPEAKKSKTKKHKELFSIKNLISVLVPCIILFVSLLVFYIFELKN